MKEVVVLTGGAGYIGSHTAYLLHKKGYQVVVIDTFLHQQPNVVSWAEVIRADIADTQLLHEVFTKYRVLGVMHFAALIEVGESVKFPNKFYHNNVVKSLALLDAMVTHNVFPIVFSSSCAVYGSPTVVPIPESHGFAPLSPYGKNKLAVEYALQDYATAYGLKYASLRYFNAAGALPEAGLGEYHKPETHVIPLLFRALQKDQAFTLFGTNYQTPDGTCIRDYIHVMDLAEAHVKALEYLIADGNSIELNLGSGMGYTVKELVTSAEKLFGKKAQVRMEDARPGDVPVLLADTSKAKKILGWQPVCSDLPTILHSAWRWEQKRNNLYAHLASV